MLSVIQKLSRASSSSALKSWRDNEISVEAKTELKDQRYFHGWLPRFDMASVLKKNGESGVRISENFEETGSGLKTRIVLSIRWNGQHKHCSIVKNEKGLNTLYGKFAFETVPELIAFFKVTKNKIGDDGAQLIRPIPRQPWQLAHNQIKMIKKLGKGDWLDLFASNCYI